MVAAGSTSRMSHASRYAKPRPATGPFTAATTGLRTRSAVSGATLGLAKCSSRCSAPLVSSASSAPAQKARPAPVTTTTRTEGSSSRASNASTYAAAIVGVTELSRSGRFSVTIPTPSAVVRMISAAGSGMVPPGRNGTGQASGRTAAAIVAARGSRCSRR